MAKYIKKKALKNAIDCCTWYHINKNGELVEGANSAEHEPLYKYSDIKKIIKGLPTRKFEDEPHIVGKHADAIIIDESRLTAKCLNCANGGSYKCSKCDGEMYFSKMYFKEEPKDEPQTDCAWR